MQICAHIFLDVPYVCVIIITTKLLQTQHCLRNVRRLSTRAHMRFPMHLQIRNAWKTSTTSLAGKPFHSGVRGNVRQQTLTIGEALRAEFTFERLFAVVLSFVDRLLAQRSKGLFAKRTFMRQLSGVHRRMRLQWSGTFVRLAAHFASEQGLFAALGGLVVDESGSAGKYACACRAWEAAGGLLFGRAFGYFGWKMEAGNAFGIDFDECDFGFGNALSKW